MKPKRTPLQDFISSCLLFAILNKQSKDAMAVVVSMWTQDQMIVLNAGQSAELDCQFFSESYNMFNNPVVWKKHQRQEESEINIMGNILQPFLATGRFLVTFTNNSPRYRTRLRITDLSLEDSGNYTCLIRGAKSTILGSVTHYIFIRAPVQSVYFIVRNTSVLTRDSDEEDLVVTELTVIQGSPVSLRCVSIGGYPPPEVHIHAADTDVTDQFSSYHAPTMAGERGLRLMMYRIERWTDGLKMSADDDGKVYRCLSVVSDVGSLLATVKIYVNYPPRIRCSPGSASLGEKNVFLLCEVRSRPSLSALYWQIDRNGTTVIEGLVRGEYWTLVMVRSDDVTVTQLFMRRVTADSFRRYTIWAENAIDMTHEDVDLIERPPPPTAPLTILELRGNQKKGSKIVKPFSSADTHRYSYASTNNCHNLTSISTAFLFIFSMLISTTLYSKILGHSNNNRQLL